MTYLLALPVAALLFVLWDVSRRFINDKRAAREFEREVASEVVTQLQALQAELKTLVVYLKDRNAVQESALKESITQMRELVKFSDDNRKQAESRLLSGALKGRNT